MDSSLMDNSLKTGQYFLSFLEGNSELMQMLGCQGTQGEQGTQGYQGTQGFQGTQGEQGTQGLQGTQGFNGAQQSKIFPLIAKEGTPYPLVIYTREGITTKYTKPTYPMGGWDNTVTISYRIYSDKYDETLEIANLIRNILEGKNYRDQNIVINHVDLISCYEAFAEDAFVQTLTFSTMVE